MGALQVRLSAEDVLRISEAIPLGAAAGDRYPDMAGVTTRGTVKLSEKDVSILSLGLNQAALAIPVTSAQVVKARARR